MTPTKVWIISITLAIILGAGLFVASAFFANQLAIGLSALVF